MSCSSLFFKHAAFRHPPSAFSRRHSNIVTRAYIFPLSVPVASFLFSLVVSLFFLSPSLSCHPFCDFFPSLSSRLVNARFLSESELFLETVTCCARRFDRFSFYSKSHHTSSRCLAVVYLSKVFLARSMICSENSFTAFIVVRAPLTCYYCGRILV